MGQWTASAAQHQLGHVKGGPHFAGVMGVVVNDETSLPIAAEIKAATRGTQLAETVL